MTVFRDGEDRRKVAYPSPLFKLLKTTHMDHFVNDILRNAFQPVENRLMPLAAIWMDRQLTIEDGTKSARITPGMRIRVTGGFVDTDSTMPTHVVNNCVGTITSSELYLDLIEIETDQPLRLKIN